MIKLLAFCWVFCKHAGENQAQIVLDVLDEFQVQERIGCLVGDNAASNDTTVSTILKAQSPKLTQKQQTLIRIWCLGHIVDLCAQALIFGKVKGNGREGFARVERKGDDGGWKSAW